MLDVGTGSGILAIWAAKAGARKVYAVEATYMADHARTLCAANGVGDIVEARPRACAARFPAAPAEHRLLLLRPAGDSDHS